jgi:hypothetical protein
MFAACPHCHFLIALHPQKRVVPATCPRCGKQVDDGSSATAETAAIETGEEMPVAGSSSQRPATEASVTESAAADTASHPPDAGAADINADADGALTPDTPSDLPTTKSEENDDAVAAPRENAPSARLTHTTTAIPRFTHTASTSRVRPPVPRWQWIALIALSLLLAIQTMLADRTRLAADASWRPLVAHLCGVFRCSIPVWRQPEAFTMLSRDVRPVGGSPGTLQAQATFRNDARWAQAWPIVLLTLKDADGRTLGARALMPSEYLDAGQAQNEIAPGQSAQIAVRIREPSVNVVAFSFDFR